MRLEKKKTPSEMVKFVMECISLTANTNGKFLAFTFDLAAHTENTHNVETTSYSVVCV